MRSRASLFASLLLLTSCVSGNTVRLTLTYDTDDAARRTELASAASRVIERRLLALDQEVKQGDVTVQGDIIVARIRSKEAVDMLRTQLKRPFTLRVMRESDEASADVRHLNFGFYKETGITEDHFDWVTAQAGPGNGATAVMKLTPEGQQILKRVFTENDGKKIGIFLRDVLMSQRIADADDPAEGIDVEGIPSKDIALVFADDVNVGLHVTFTEQ